MSALPPDDADFPLEGGCACKSVRYRMSTRPLVVHCCHCTYCQRESGTAFALNAVIEADRVLTLQGAPEPIVTPSHSGKGQTICRCPVCKVAVWSHYAAAGAAFRFIRVGTLDSTGLAAAGCSHLHEHQAAVGGVARRGAGGAGVLSAEGGLVGGESGAVGGGAGERGGVRAAVVVGRRQVGHLGERRQRAAEVLLFVE